jgi:diguanylate cyclase (GGDEF)-like protein/PAS domain S-box-containing protein
MDPDEDRAPAPSVRRDPQPKNHGPERRLAGRPEEATPRLAQPTGGAPGEAGQWFRTLAETTSTAILVYHRDGLIYANRAAEALSGFSAAELLGMPPWRLAHPDHQTLVRERIRARLHGEPVPARYEVKMLTRDGCERWVELTSAVIEAGGGSAEATALTTVVDVTERKLAEEALRESHAHLELAQYVSGVIPWEWNLVTDAMAIAPHAAEVLGCGPEALWTSGREFQDAVCEEDRQELAAALKRCLEAGRDFAVELRVVLPDGGLRWLSYRGRALRDETGAAARLIGVAQDVSERKRAEEQLRAMVEGTSASIGTDFLRSLVRHLAQALGVRYAFAGELMPESPDRVRLVALWTGDEYGEPFEYDLRGTPCDSVVGRQHVAIPADAWRLYPDDAWLRSARIESYVAVPLFNADERPLGLIGVMDVKPLSEGLPALSILKIFAARAAAEVERRLAEEALAQEKERAQVTLASIGDGVIRTDAGGRIDYLNPVAERLTGWTAAEAFHQPVLRVFQVVDEATGKPLPNPVERCLREGRVIELPGSSLLIPRHGGELWIRDSVAPIRDRQGRITGSVLVFKDVTQLRGMEREMAFLARHDPLTGLINRRELERRLQDAIETASQEGREHAFFYFDLDEFKLVNDTCGHLAGDELLKQLGSLLRSRLRKTDSLARLGGDEFGVLLEDIAPDRARRVGEEIRKVVQGFRFTWQERAFEVGVSLGLVPITAGSGDLAQVLSAADAACSMAKESGGNRLHEYQPDDTALAERYGAMQWIHRIRNAFAEDRFCLYRQSIEPLAARPGEPPLLEIFIRMRDEEGRIIAPGAFIPAAERYHLISAIDRWVVHTAFAALAARREPACFAINLSGQSLGDEAFLAAVLAELEATGADPRRVCFEITETAAVGNLAQAMRFIGALKELGCRFVLDDFGSGLSSFAYLKNLPVDFLKIDGAFVRGMADNTVQRALVQSIHQIGRVMGIHTVAESVEDRETLEALRQIGVDYAQGYCLSLPEPLE